MLLRRGLVLAVMMAAGAASAGAAENFIPQGHSYSPGRELLPRLNSEQDRVNLGTDLLQSEIYRIQRQRQQFNSELNRFIYDQNPDPTDNSLDY